MKIIFSIVYFQMSQRNFKNSKATTKFIANSSSESMSAGQLESFYDSFLFPVYLRNLLMLMEVNDLLAIGEETVV